MVVIKYYTTFLNMTNATYEIATTPFKVGKVVTKEEAKRYIRENGLVLAHKDKDGCVWDTPNRDFYQKFQGSAKDIRD
jgi:hypothetical protein